MARDPKDLKEALRERIWRLLEERGLARPPMPVKGRIPNFVGAERACELASSTEEFSGAGVIKVNPDSPQAFIRYLALREGKTLVVPSPRLRSGFLILDPEEIPSRALREAATIRGAFRWGRIATPEEIPRVDLVVVGSVAVNLKGSRVGKGGGYADLEYGLLRSLGKAGDSTPVITTVHEVQVVDDETPMEPHDLPVDVVVTDKRILRVERVYPKPQGIYWDLIGCERILEIPVLRALASRLGKRLECLEPRPRDR